MKLVRGKFNLPRETVYWLGAKIGMYVGKY